MSKAPKTSILKLSNGLRLVHIHEPGCGSAIFGMAVGAGSAAEKPEEFGLAHLVEHTIFKGTTRRRAWHVINRMETVGGELNAYTTKEATVLYSVFPRPYTARAAELIADLCINSVFPEKELVKEREVVIDEILSYRDTPAEAIYDDFEDLLYAGSPLGHNILGSENSVRSLTGADCRRFLTENYTVSNSVLFYTGPSGAETVATLAEKYFSELPQGKPRVQGALAQAHSFNITERLPLHQCHTILGINTDGLRSDEKYSVALLANILGGPGMNSLLNIELRERHGLVYTVEASTAFFLHNGLLTIYYGCDAEDSDRCLGLCQRTISALADSDTLLTPRRLAAAQKQYLGQRSIAAENRENRIFAAARSLLFTGNIPDYAEITEKIREISAGSLRALAARLTSPSILIFQPDNKTL